MENKRLFTLEERLKMAANSKASSPEAAASLVQHLYKLHTALFVSWGFDKMSGLIKEEMNEIDEKLLYYGGFCHSFRLAMEKDNAKFCPSPSEAFAGITYNFCWGIRLNNALVLMGLVMLDHMKGKNNKKDVYHCMRMTLRQYLDALVDISIQKDGTPDFKRIERLRFYREALLKEYDGSRSMKETLIDILNRYSSAKWKVDGIQIPDLGSGDIQSELWADSLFAADKGYWGYNSTPTKLYWNYHPAPMRDINMAVLSLYVLFVEPYLEMGEYHYERHLQDEEMER